MITDVVRQFVEREQLLDWEGKVLVALSGGADSVALLRILLQLGYRVEAAHCNFHLRGGESDRDEGFVRNLCAVQGVRLHRIDFNTRDYAGRHKVSLEMAARELRYEWFGRLLVETGIHSVAVAHHRDDSVETLLLNLLRGTGIAGLHGIRPCNGTVVRPLLGVGRAELLDYLQRIGQDYVTDSSNLSEEFTRNKIRLSLLPLLEEINPSVRKGLVQTASHLFEVEKVYRAAIAQAFRRVFVRDPASKEEPGGGRIRIGELQKEPSPKALLHEILSPYGFTSSQVEDLYRALEGEPGKIFRAGKWIVLKDREELLLYIRPEAETVPRFSVEEVRHDTGFSVPRDPSVACVDADKITGSLSIRKWRKGDWFVPLGMKGRKLVSDFLTDRKKSLREKEQQCVVTEGERIVWLVGERLDHRYRVTDSTKRVFLVRIKV